MGRPKALLPVGAGTLLSAHVRQLRDAGLPVRVAVGAHIAGVEAEAIASGGTPYRNEAWASTGPLDSLRSCATELAPHTRLLVTPVDVPPAPLLALRTLIAALGPVVPLAGGVEAHPVVVEARAVQEAGSCMTLRDLLADAPRVPVMLPDGHRNLNTPEDFRRWRAAVDARR